MSTKPENLNLNSPYIKIIFGAFVIGGAWTRLEYKSNELTRQILKKIDEHIISDGFEKKMLDNRLVELSERISTLEYNANNSEFVRPNDLRLQNKKRRNETKTN